MEESAWSSKWGTFKVSGSFPEGDPGKHGMRSSEEIWKKGKSTKTLLKVEMLGSPSSETVQPMEAWKTY